MPSRLRLPRPPNLPRPPKLPSRRGLSRLRRSLQRRRHLQRSPRLLCQRRDGVPRARRPAFPAARSLLLPGLRGPNQAGRSRPHQGAVQHPRRDPPPEELERGARPRVHRAAAQVGADQVAVEDSVVAGAADSAAVQVDRLPVPVVGRPEEVGPPSAALGGVVGTSKSSSRLRPPPTCRRTPRFQTQR